MALGESMPNPTLLSLATLAGLCSAACVARRSCCEPNLARNLKIRQARAGNRAWHSLTAGGIKRQASDIHGVLRRPAESPDIAGNHHLNRKGSDRGNGFGKACRILKHQSPIAACGG